MHEAFHVGGFLETSRGRSSSERLCEEKIQLLATHRRLLMARRFVKGRLHTLRSENSSKYFCEETLSLFICLLACLFVKVVLAQVASRSVPAGFVKSM